MLFALWLLSVSSETSRPVQIGVYRSIESCKIAATNAVLVGPADILDFDKAKFGDGIKSVMENNKDSRLLGLWQFPVPLRDVSDKGQFLF
jgi:hypothetical protein